MSGLCTVLPHPSLKICFLIISFWSLIVFQAVRLLWNPGLHTLELGFLGSKFYFDKPFKLPLHPKQHEPELLFSWKAAFLLRCSTGLSEAPCSCAVSRWMDATLELSKASCGAPCLEAVGLLCHMKEAVLLPGLMKQAANSCFEVPLLSLAMFQF